MPAALRLALVALLVATRITTAQETATEQVAAADVIRRMSELERSLMRRSEEHTSELQLAVHFVCRLLLEKKKFCANCVDAGAVWLPPETAARFVAFPPVAVSC